MDEATLTIQQRVLLLSPSLGYWRGLYQPPRPEKLEIKLAGDVLSNDYTTVPRIKLLTDEWPIRRADGKPWLKLFRDMANEQKQLVDSYSLPFPIRGVRIVPRLVGAEFLEAMQGTTVGQLRRQLADAERTGRLASHVRELRERLAAAIAADPDAALDDSLPVAGVERESIAYRLRKLALAFVNDINNVLEQITNKLGLTTWHLIRNKIPRDRSAMLARFTVSTTPIELAGGDSRTVDTDELKHYRDALAAACRQKAEQAAEIMFAAPRQQLAKALADFTGLLDREGRITARSFAPVEEAIRKVRLFNFVADEKLLDQISDIEKKLNETSAEELRENREIAIGLSTAIGAVAVDVQKNLQQHQSYTNDDDGHASFRHLEL